jgi:uncharacterized protein
VKVVFADTAYWIAVFRPTDPWAEAARAARLRLGRIRLFTVDEVLAEFLAALSAGGPLVRSRAAMFTRRLLEHPHVTVVPQTRKGFLEGLDLYERRRDKNYSLTDCIAMKTMRKTSLTEVLTSDRHFEREGFRILMR